jgi:glycosyltransferase involved in cell wall biosynthesis
MQIILIGNYKRDRQESMLRFATMLAKAYRKKGFIVRCWSPIAIFGLPFTLTNAGLGKWCAYIDKWIVFPLWLQACRIFTTDKRTHFHICDHSNAPYLKYLPAERTCITCHDVLAIRGALGYTDAYAPASQFGKMLQRYIFYYLSRAKQLAAVSQFTLNQLQALAPDSLSGQKDWRVIHNSFNGDFTAVEERKRRTLLVKAGLDGECRYILHIGSGHPRKNRRMLIDMLAALNDQWTGKICYAGEELDQALKNYAISLGLGDRIISIPNPDHDTLNALYGSCDAFIFPSFSEGFGWPVIEAQACGAPVIASNIAPMPEISGGAVLYADPHKPAEFARALLQLQDERKRSELIRLGYKNTSRFKEKEMIESYIDLQNLQLASQ